MPRSPREVAELVRQMVEGKSGIQFADLFAPDGVLEYPFAIPGVPSTLDGRDAIREAFQARQGIRESLQMSEVTSVVHETGDPEVVITEIEHHGTSHITNAPYQVRALGIMRVRAGKIVHYRDYMNPLAVAELTGQLPDLISALGTGAGK
jgi:ketosteroid isomerase-like protein